MKDVLLSFYATWQHVYIHASSNMAYSYCVCFPLLHGMANLKVRDVKLFFHVYISPRIMKRKRVREGESERDTEREN